MWKSILTLAAAFFLATSPANAEQPKPKQMHNTNSVWFENWVGLSNATLKVAAPNGKITTVFKATGSPVFRLSGAPIQNGVYRFELRAASDERVAADPNRAQLGDEDLPDTVPRPLYMTGAFVVERGAIKPPEVAKNTRDGT